MLQTASLSQKRRLPESNRWEAPEGARAEIPVLQDLRGKRAAIEVQDGPLTTPCWIWRGSLNSKDYPLRRTNATGHVLVHRAVYEHVHGELATGEQVHHLCEETACVNPGHLEARAHLEHERLHAGAGSVAAIVFRELAAGRPRRYSEITAAVSEAGMSPASGGVGLHRMVRRGEIVQLRRGVYALVEETA